MCMRQIILILLLFLGGSQILSSQVQTLVFGKIIDPITDNVETRFLVDPISAQQKVSQTILDADGSFLIVLNFDSARFVDLIHGKEKTRLFIIPGQEYHLSFEGKALIKSLKTQDRDNQFLQEFQEEIGWAFYDNSIHGMPALLTPRTMYNQLKPLGWNARFIWLDNERRQVNHYLRMHPKIATISPDLSKHLLDYVKFQMLSVQLRFIQPDSLSNQLSTQFYDELKKVNLTTLGNSNLGYYQMFLDEYAWFQLENNSKGVDYFEDWKAFYDLVETELTEVNPAVIDIILGRLLYRNLNPKKAQAIAPYLDKYLKRNQSDANAQAVLNRYQLAAKYADGTSAPDFTLRDLSGNEVKLSDLKGKIVYLSFWASWCSRCIEEMSAAKENRAKLMKEDDLVFLYVSIDDKESTWKNHYMVPLTSGKHLYAPGAKSKVAKDYGLLSLPRYFLIDKNGKFVSKFPKSSEPAFIDFIQAELNK